MKTNVLFAALVLLLGCSGPSTDGLFGPTTASSGDTGSSSGDQSSSTGGDGGSGSGGQASSSTVGSTTSVGGGQSSSSSGTGGSCICSLDNVTVSTCSQGQCVIQECLPNYGDCNNVVADGCETSFHDDQNCGSCGNVCTSGMSCSWQDLTSPGSCICQGAYTSTNSQAEYCFSCLESACCQTVLDCQNNPTCNDQLVQWDSCVKNNGINGCIFDIPALHTCMQQNGCGC